MRVRITQRSHNSALLTLQLCLISKILFITSKAQGTETDTFNLMGGTNNIVDKQSNIVV